VFTSFTMSQSGMAKHHLTHKEPGWRTGLFINATGAFLSLVVTAIIAITKFTRGAWIVIVIVPVLVALLVRLNRQYESEAVELEENAARAAEANPLRRHAVIVFIEHLDLASARAIQYARTLAPDELRAVHFDLDPIQTEDLITAWQHLGFDRLTLDVVECPDRRITRCAAELVAETLGEDETEVTVLIPQRKYRRFWHRLLHDRTADAIAEALDTMTHVNVTIVPYVLGADSSTGADGESPMPFEPRAKPRNRAKKKNATPKITGLPPGCISIASAEYRRPARLAGRVRSVRVQPLAGVPSLEVRLADESGTILVVFIGRRRIGGIKPGAQLVVDGVVGQRSGRLAIMNPYYELIATPEHELPPAGH
jgi:hypothetical protein